MAKHKVWQDHPGCIGCGACSTVCPKFWEMGDDGKAHIKGATLNTEERQEIEIEDADLASNKEAEASCPVSVIHVEE